MNPGARILLALVVFFSIAVFLGLLSCWYFSQAPHPFGENRAILIEPGSTASDVAAIFEENDIVRSKNLLYAIVVLFHDPSAIKAGQYVFESTDNTFTIAARITGEAPREPLLAVTYPEGFTAREYADIAEAILPNFDSDAFLNSATEREGFLFPETYHVPERYTEADMLTLLENTYYERTQSIRSLLEQHALNERGVVTLASIVEREANTPESMRMVAGVLLNRLLIDMPLQADATMEYVLEKPLQELTPDDLEIDSPYNTYLYRGLTPTPIGNPGLIAINAVLKPASTSALYYITDTEGIFHYAETFAEHRANIARYLK